MASLYHSFYSSNALIWITTMTPQSPCRGHYFRVYNPNSNSTKIGGDSIIRISTILLDNTCYTNKWGISMTVVATSRTSIYITLFIYLVLITKARFPHKKIIKENNQSITNQENQTASIRKHTIRIIHLIQHHTQNCKSSK